MSKGATPSESARGGELTIQLSGLNPETFRPVGPTIIGQKVKIVLELDPATGQAVFEVSPQDSLLPSQVLQLVIGALAPVIQVAAANEAAMLEASRGLAGGRVV